MGGLRLKPYPEYKDSGVECLGDVPVHWEVKQLGRMGLFSKGNGGTEEDEVTDGVPLCLISRTKPTSFKQFSDNPAFKRWLSDTIFNETYRAA